MTKLPRGYEFIFDDGSGDLLILPITPAELTIKSGSRNETIDLINDGEINVLKSPSLIEVEFDARFPMREYPYSRVPADFQAYFDKFSELKNSKKSFRFIVGRSDGVTNSPYETNLLVSLEDFETKESADEGDDIICSFSLKQYKPYGVKMLDSSNYVARDTNKGQDSFTYKVQSGDTLWGIAKAAYGDGSLWRKIYEANFNTLESTAQKHGYESSRDGYVLFPGTQLIIPGFTGEELNVEKVKASTNEKKGTVIENIPITDSQNKYVIPNSYADTGMHNRSHSMIIRIKTYGVSAYAGTIVAEYEKNGVRVVKKIDSLYYDDYFIVDYDTTFKLIVTPVKGHSFNIAGLGVLWKKRSTESSQSVYTITNNSNLPGTSHLVEIMWRR